MRNIISQASQFSFCSNIISWENFNCQLILSDELLFTQNGSIAEQGACDCSMENCVLKLSPSVSNISSKYHMRFYFEITDGRLLRPTQKEFQPQISITPVSKTGASFIKYQTMPQLCTCDIFCSLLNRCNYNNRNGHDG